MPIVCVCDECGIEEPAVHIKDYLFTKPRSWFQRSVMADGPAPGEKVEASVLIACSHDCAKALKSKYPEDKIGLRVVE